MTAPPPPPEVAYTLPFSALDANDLPRVGGKGANLGALTRAGVPVPDGFCVTTAAYDRFVAALPDADAHFAALDALDGASLDDARAAAEAMRAALATCPLPDDVAETVRAAHAALGVEHPLAVRSSATAEDLPGASFAGQQDTYLNVVGEESVLDAVRRCWISLFTDRAVLYRARGRFGHRNVRLAVVVQRLVQPEVSGILFTADPVSGHRAVASIDAGFGLGEALVGGLIAADLYRVDRRRHVVLDAAPGDKAFAIRATPGGGTFREPLDAARRTARCLDDAQVLRLAALGDRVEAHYGGVPQDIEWCLAGGEFFVVQARPITSLYPLPVGSPTDEGLRVYASFGHVQMMLDAMPRLAREVWAYVFPAGKGAAVTRDTPAALSPVMYTAGSRIYLDATPAMKVPLARGLLLAVLGHVYADLARAIAVLSMRVDFRSDGDLAGLARSFARTMGPVVSRIPATLLLRDPIAMAEAFDRAVDEVPARVRARIAAAPTAAGRIRQCACELHGLFAEMRPLLPHLFGGILAHRLLTALAKGRWADGVRDQVDQLLRGLPGNVTTDMDLAVGDLTDLARPHPALADLLAAKPWREVLPLLPKVEGGPAFAAAMERFLARYGDRGAGEIDLSRPRWRDDPGMLLRAITGALSGGEVGAHRRQHRVQAEAGEAAVTRLVEAAGALRRPIVRRLARVARYGMAKREHPKFVVIQVLGLVRSEVLAAGETLVARAQLTRAEDVWHLGFEELAAALDAPASDLRAEVARRAEAFAHDRARKPPPVMSSDGECPTLAVDRADLPPGALAGTAASAGVVEGLARIVRDPEREVLHAGEILVAPFTDPGWTPLFVHAAGVVTEVGGLMTHGAVVAREYGIPAVVSVADALTKIRTGQRIRVDGTRGFVEIIGEP